MLDTNIIVRWVMLFPIPERVLPHEDPADNQRNDTADEVAPGDDTPGNIVPWPVFGLPHERGNGVSHTIGNQDDRVGRDPFSMTCRDGGGPGKDEDSPGQTETKCPGRKQKPDLVPPWQEGDEKASQKVGDSTKADDVGTGVRNASRELKNLLVRRHADERLRANLNSDENGDNSNHTVDAPKQGSLKGVPSKGTNDDEALVYERGGDVVEGSGEGEQPCLGVSQSFDHLFLLERLVLHTRLVLPDPEDGLRALLRGEEPGIRRGVWE